MPPAARRFTARFRTKWLSTRGPLPKVCFSRFNDIAYWWLLGKGTDILFRHNNRAFHGTILCYAFASLLFRGQLG